MTVASVTFGLSGGLMQSMRLEEAGTILITPTAENQVSFTSPFPRTLVRLVTDVAIYASAGEDPNALTDTNRFYIPPNTPEYFILGEGRKIAVTLA